MGCGHSSPLDQISEHHAAMSSIVDLLEFIDTDENRPSTSCLFVYG